MSPRHPKAPPNKHARYMGSRILGIPNMGLHQTSCPKERILTKDKPWWDIQGQQLTRSIYTQFSVYILHTPPFWSPWFGASFSTPGADSTLGARHTMGVGRGGVVGTASACQVSRHVVLTPDELGCPFSDPLLKVNNSKLRSNGN